MAEFEGPLALLLSLIEARQLDVLTVPLGRARRRLSRCARTTRRRPARQHQRVRRGREPAHPDQEPRDAAAAGPTRPTRRARRRGCRPRGGTARAAAALPGVPRRRDPPRRRRPRTDRALPARAVGRARGRDGRCPAGRTRRRSTRPGSSGALVSARRDRTATGAAARGDAPDDQHQRARRDHPDRPCATPRGSSSRTS